jgi:hypothetical protein
VPLMGSWFFLQCVFVLIFCKSCLVCLSPPSRATACDCPFHILHLFLPPPPPPLLLPPLPLLMPPPPSRNCFSSQCRLMIPLATSNSRPP